MNETSKIHFSQFIRGIISKKLKFAPRIFVGPGGINTLIEWKDSRWRFHTATPKIIKVVQNSEIQKSDPQLQK